MQCVEECAFQLKAWKAGLESKGIYVNMKKTKFLVSDTGLDILKELGKYPLLSVALESTAIPSSAYSVRCGSIGITAASLVDWWLTLILSAPQVVLPWGLRQCHCCQMLRGLGKIKKIKIVPPHHPAHLGQGAWQDVHDLRPFSYTPPWLVGSVAPTNKTKRFHIHYCRNFALRILRQSFEVRGSCFDMCWLFVLGSHRMHSLCSSSPQGRRPHSCVSLGGMRFFTYASCVQSRCKWGLQCDYHCVFYPSYRISCRHYKLQRLQGRPGQSVWRPFRFCVTM